MGKPAGFWILVAIEGLMAAGYAVSFPFLAVYLSGQRHMSMSLTGLFLALSMLTASFAHLVGGELADILGRRRVMLWALLLRCAVVAFMAWIIGAGGSMLPLLIAHPVGLFIGFSFSPAARSWVADSVGSASRMKAYGLLRVGTNAGWALGPAVGGVLAAGSYAVMFAVTAAVYLLAAAAVFLFIRDSAVFEKRTSSGLDLKTAAATLKNREFRDFCALSFMMCAVMSQLVISTSLYYTRYLGFSERQIGLLFSLNGGMVVTFQYLATRVLERSRISRGLMTGALFYAAGYLTVGYAGAFVSALIGIAVVSIGEVAVSPGLQALGANMAPPREKGRYLGVQGLFQQAGSSAGIFLGSNAISLISPHYRPGPWLIIVMLALTAALGFRSLGRRLSRRADGLREPFLPPPSESPETV